MVLNYEKTYGGKVLEIGDSIEPHGIVQSIYRKDGIVRIEFLNKYHSIYSFPIKNLNFPTCKDINPVGNLIFDTIDKKAFIPLNNSFILTSNYIERNLTSIISEPDRYVYDPEYHNRYRHVSDLIEKCCAWSNWGIGECNHINDPINKINKINDMGEATFTTIHNDHEITWFADEIDPTFPRLTGFWAVYDEILAMENDYE